jgi:hypothetical protein
MHFTMPLRYSSGEEVRTGDCILYAGEAGRVEFIATPNDLETTWYADQFGGGCMLLTPAFGRLFVRDPQAEEDLEFVSRVIAES